MRILQFVLILCSFMIFTSFAQKYPFPQDIKYPYGFNPTTVTTEKLKSWYKSYLARTDLLQACNGGMRPGVDGGTNSKVEAQGWAMIIAAYMGDKTTFDGLYSFYKSKCTSSNGGMMDWHTTCSGVVEGGSATDGDMDVGFALCVAYWQWGDSYLTEAKKVIANLKKLLVTCNGVSTVAAGYSAGHTYGGCNETDMSYHTPAYFRVFAEITADAAWTKLADDTYITLNNGANKTTGLVPDWQTQAGQAGPNGRNGTYKYDACRVPWRMALDYLWNGNEKALDWCKKVSSWANGIGAANIKDGYNLDGSANGQYHNMSYVGAFAVAAMCNSQSVADVFGSEINKMSFDTYWYHAYLGNCYLLTMTGNMWRPDLIKPVDVKNIKTSASGKGTVISGAKHTLLISGLQNVHSVFLTDLMGHQVMRLSTVTTDNVSLDISSLKNGCYIVSTVKENGTIQKTQKVMIY